VCFEITFISVTFIHAQIPHGKVRGSSGHGTQAVLGAVDVTIHNWAVFYVRDVNVSRGITQVRTGDRTGK
jgi:sulfur relay (sulfurtransferase) DsrF/TusC family protein